jgi:dihydrofolate reductase
MKHDLVDAFWLTIIPITLGSGKPLFADGTIPAAFNVTESTVTSKGVIMIEHILDVSYDLTPTSAT